MSKDKDKKPEIRAFLEELIGLFGRYNAEIEYIYDYRCGERQNEELLISIGNGETFEYVDLGLQIDTNILAGLVGEEGK